jgi:hypothetical protein
MANDEIPFRKAGQVAGLAYNTIKRRRYHGNLPFPVYERQLTPGKRPMLFCLASEIEAWKQRVTSKVPAGA